MNPTDAAGVDLGVPRVDDEVREAGLQRDFGRALLQTVLDILARAGGTSGKFHPVAIGRETDLVKPDRSARWSRPIVLRDRGTGGEKGDRERSPGDPSLGNALADDTT